MYTGRGRRDQGQTPVAPVRPAINHCSATAHKALVQPEPARASPVPVPTPRSPRSPFPPQHLSHLPPSLYPLAARPLAIILPHRTPSRVEWGKAGGAQLRILPSSIFDASPPALANPCARSPSPSPSPPSFPFQPQLPSDPPFSPPAITGTSPIPSPISMNLPPPSPFPLPSAGPLAPLSPPP